MDKLSPVMTSDTVILEYEAIKKDKDKHKPK
jgi:hypothetical protein